MGSYAADSLHSSRFDVPDGETPLPLLTSAHEHKFSLVFASFPKLFISSSRALQSTFKSMLTSEFRPEMSPNAPLLPLVEDIISQHTTSLSLSITN